MKKYRFYYFPAVVTTVFTFTFALALAGCRFEMHDSSYLPETTMFEMFRNSGAAFVGSEISFQAKLDTRYQNEDDLNKLVEGLIESLEIIDDYESDKYVNENDFMQIMERNGKTRGGETVSIFIEMKKAEGGLREGNGGSKEAGSGLKKEDEELKAAEGGELEQSVFSEGVINLSISGSSTSDRTREIRSNVETVFARHEIKHGVKCTMAGFFDGKLDARKMNEICKNMFSTLDARKVNGIAGKNLVGVSAYSPAIGSFIEIDGNRSNIQLNFRYSAYENKTFIWIGIPVIF